MQIDDIYKKAIETYGKEVQIIVAIEEMSELQKELCKYFRVNINTHIAEEIADVEIMMEQIKMIFDIEKEVIREKAFKISRLEKRLEGVNLE